MIEDIITRQFTRINRQDDGNELTLEQLLKI